VHVVIKNAGVTNARVTATRDDGVTYEAVAPVPPGTDFIIAGLRPGAYVVRVEAPGFTTETASITAPIGTPVEISLQANGAFMPELFGSTLRAALQELSSRKIAVGRILDVVGRDVAPANPGSDYNDQPILAHFPSAGTAVPPEGHASHRPHHRRAGAERALLRGARVEREAPWLTRSFRSKRWVSCSGKSSPKHRQKEKHHGRQHQERRDQAGGERRIRRPQRAAGQSQDRPPGL
jgi:hypothetical protein